MFGPTSSYVACSVGLAILVLSAAAPAAAQDQTRILDLNSEALEAYQNLDIDTAEAKLQEALSVAEKSGYAGPEAAQTLVNLGVIFVAGKGDLDQGLASFVSALCMHPDVQLDPLLSTPDVQQVFIQAQSDAQAGACGPGGPPAAGAAPPQGGGYGQQGGYGQGGYGQGGYGQGGYGGQQQYMPGPQPGPVASYGAADDECPPGMVCGGDGGGGKGPTDFARFFVNLSFGLGFTHMTPGKKADAPPLNPSGEVYTTRWVEEQPLDADGDGVQDVNMMGEPQFIPGHQEDLFRENSAWVPDADSFDDNDAGARNFSTKNSLGSKCEGDGIRTGPLDQPDTGNLVLDPATQAMVPGVFTDMNPSSYCVRVSTPGFVNNPILRANVGYFLTDWFALSLPFRFQFSAGEGSLSSMLIGLRAEFVFNPIEEEATGFPVSFFLGGTYGQIQAQAPRSSGGPAPYAISGPAGAHAGVAARWRFMRNVGLILAPELDFQFPDFMFNIDAVAGLEAAF